MRNESNAVRMMTKEAGAAYQPGYVPWRAVTMRPLLRTNIGSAPTITGKLKAACGTLAAGATVSVPAGIIQVRIFGKITRLVFQFMTPGCVCRVSWTGDRRHIRGEPRH